MPKRGLVGRRLHAGEKQNPRELSPLFCFLFLGNTNAEKGAGGEEASCPWRGIILEGCVHSTSGKCGPLVASVAIEL
jgi:hypothetical protein